VVDIVNDVVLKVVSPVTTLALGYASPYLRARYRYRRTTKFWKPITRRTALAVVGSHESEFEPGRLVGFGDVRALDDLRSFFKDARLPMMDINYDKAVASREREQNLVLIGGPKPNMLVKAVLESSKTQLTFDEPEPYVFSLSDGATDVRYVPERRNGTVAKDFGMIISTPNPFAADQQSRVLIFAGCYGYGTWAAVRLASTHDSLLLRNTVASSGAPFETVVQVDVVGSEPATATFVVEPRGLKA
jgi:hypothetical protein